MAAHQPKFEAAATWYRLDCRAPKRIAPSHLVRRVNTVGNQARALLKALAITDPAAATDGPQDLALLEALASAGETDADSVRLL